MAAPNPVEAKPRFFSVEEANKMLPLVRAIVGDIVRQFAVVNSLKEKLVELKNLRRRPGGFDDFETEVTKVETEFAAEEALLISFVEELSKLGVELKGPDGLCDFPSLRDGREVYLCWKLGEPDVRFWHEVSAGFAGRQVLEQGS